MKKANPQADVKTEKHKHTNTQTIKKNPPKKEQKDSEKEEGGVEGGLGYWSVSKA